MAAARRVYMYVVAAASLGMLVVGLAAVGATILDLALSPAAIASTFRQSLATYGALVVWGLPVWAVHWGLAQRFADRDPGERASALRRLYLYAVLGALLVSLAFLATDVVQRLLGALLDRGARFDGVALARTGWQALIVAGAWAYHFAIAARDRARVGEQGASATLRRWYGYGVQLVAFASLLFGAEELLRSIALAVLQPASIVREDALVAAVARTLVSAGIWLFHSRWSGGAALLPQDRQSTLRAVQGFLLLGLSVALSLFAASRVLYYTVARALGVGEPGGVRGDLATALAEPAAAMVVFGLAWGAMRWWLARDASGGEAARQAGVRRLYSHLVALVSLLALSVGVAGTLWTLGDVLLVATTPVRPEAWRDQLSLYVTLVAVGLLVWLSHWRPAPDLAERLSLGRRIYVFAALLLSVLSLLGSGASLAYRLLDLLLATGGAAPFELSQTVAAVLVSVGVAAYHWRMVRADGRARAAVEPASEPPTRPVVVDVRGATEDDVRRALEGLPAAASYVVRRP